MTNLKNEKFFKALAAFEKSLSAQIGQEDLQRDAPIQRFEFTFELAWKALKDFYYEKGIALNSPKDVFRHIFASGDIQDETLWLNMLQDRHLTSHTYNEGLSREVFAHLPIYCNAFQTIKNLLNHLSLNP